MTWFFVYVLVLWFKFLYILVNHKWIVSWLMKKNMHNLYISSLNAVNIDALLVCCICMNNVKWNGDDALSFSYQLLCFKSGSHSLKNHVEDDQKSNEKKRKMKCKQSTSQTGVEQAYDICDSYKDTKRLEKSSFSSIGRIWWN